MTAILLWWGFAVLMASAGLWLVMKPGGYVAFQRRLLEWQLAMLDRGTGQKLGRLTGWLMLASAVLIVLLLSMGHTPFEAFL